MGFLRHVEIKASGPGIIVAMLSGRSNGAQNTEVAEKVTRM